VKEEFEIARKRVAIYRIGARNLTLKTDAGSQNAACAPIVFYNAFANEADEIARALSKLGGVNLTLAAVGGLDWGSEMTPWPMPVLFKKEPPFEGEADEYLQTLTQQIAPAVLARMMRSIGNSMSIWRHMPQGAHASGLSAMTASALNARSPLVTAAAIAARSAQMPTG